MRNLFFSLAAAFLSFFVASTAYAVELEISYPSVGGEEFTGGGPLVWLEYLFAGAFALIGIVAFASLIFAGIKWMTSRNPGGITEAKDRITGTLLGLVLAGASYLILFLINPDLVDLSLPDLTVPDAPQGTPNSGTETSADEEEGARNNPPEVCQVGANECPFPLECIAIADDPFTTSGTCQEIGGNATQ